jgi:hypothetical protein
MPPKGHLRHPHGQVQRRQGQCQVAQKPDHLESQTGQSDFPESGQQLCSWKLIRQTISDLTATKFRRMGLSSPRLSSGALLSDWATNAWAVGTSADDVSTLSSLGRVVRSMGATTGALPSEMVRTCLGFWPWRLLRRRWLLWICRPSVGQRSFRAGKPDNPKCQTGPSDVLGGSNTAWSPAGA